MKPDRIANILVACDFSDASKRAVAWAAQLQRSVSGLEAHVVYIWNVAPEVATALPLQPVGPGEGDLRGIERELQAICREVGLNAAVSVQIETDVGAAIVARAEALSSDLIVMGTHGRGGVARAVLGSAADWVLRKSPCPVVVMRAPAAG